MIKNEDMRNSSELEWQGLQENGPTGWWGAWLVKWAEPSERGPWRQQRRALATPGTDWNCDAGVGPRAPAADSAAVLRRIQCRFSISTNGEVNKKRDGSMTTNRMGTDRRRGSRRAASGCDWAECGRCRRRRTRRPPRPRRSRACCLDEKKKKWPKAWPSIRTWRIGPDIDYQRSHWLVMTSLFSDSRGWDIMTSFVRESQWTREKRKQWFIMTSLLSEGRGWDIMTSFVRESQWTREKRKQLFWVGKKKIGWTRQRDSLEVLVAGKMALTVPG